MERGRDFINVTRQEDVAHIARLRRVPYSSMTDTPVGVGAMGIDAGTASKNALYLKAVAEHYAPGAGMDSGQGVTLYFPPGRYHIGRPWSENVRPSAGGPFGHNFRGDLVLPLNMQLQFAPGASLIPMDYATLGGAAVWAWPEGVDSGFPAERTKVLIEIEGTIDAGAQRIFDVFLEDLDLPALRALGRATPAGRIYLTSNQIREVYPEWWGAGLPPDVQGEPAPILQRRTTMALQECLDAAHRHRRYDGQALPAIPVVLSREYTIDEELMVGRRWYEAQKRTPLDPQENKSDSQLWPVGDNAESCLLRGSRALAPGARAQARIRAGTAFSRSTRGARRAANWMTGAPEDRVPVGGDADLEFSDSLIAFRDVKGMRVEDIEFDGVFRASRCLSTDVTGAGYNAQGCGITGCVFTRATRQLIHIGGEAFAWVGERVVSTPPNPTSRSLTNSHWFTNDDLSGFRFLRCLFVTAPEGPNTSDNRFMVVGVYFRADETLNMEFQDCGFRGPARPMFLACGGRHAFQNCSFQTQSYPERGFLAQAHSIADVPDGVDVFSATPYEDANLPASSWLATTMMKDVSSTSPRLYACSLTDGNTQPTQPSVVMINVTHDPPAPRAGTPLAPAILWGVVGVFGARLVLIGCRFKRPPSTHPNSVNAPVLVEWGLVVPPAMGLVPWAAEGQSRGHILDLGNQIILAGALAPPLVKLGASVAPIEALPLLERCTTL